MQILQEGTSGDEDCVYLPAQQSRVSYRIISDCSLEVYASILKRGWRRFGRMFFRPACTACQECRSLRIPVAQFKMNRSMRRNLLANNDLEIVLQPVSLSRQHLLLYDRYHADMARRKDWNEKSINPFDLAYRAE
jgi:arginine-tRNA-protein transferase